jgi:polyferredoxin
MNTMMADLVLIVHFAFVAFVVGGLALVWIGAALGWRWVRNFWFRIAHLLAILFVAGEALVGVMCPLTIWEDALRDARADKSFIARWIHRILFYDFPEWVFTAAYVVFALVVATTWWFVRPDSRRNR